MSTRMPRTLISDYIRGSPATHRCYSAARPFVLDGWHILWHSFCGWAVWEHDPYPTIHPPTQHLRMCMYILGRQTLSTLSISVTSKCYPHHIHIKFTPRHPPYRHPCHRMLDDFWHVVTHQTPPPLCQPTTVQDYNMWAPTQHSSNHRMPLILCIVSTTISARLSQD